MSDLGEFFDLEKKNKDDERRLAHENTIAKADAAKAQAIARRKPLSDVVDPALDQAAQALESRGVVVQRRVVLRGYDGGSRPFLLFQLQSKNGRQPPSSIYLFQLYDAGFVSVSKCDHKVEYRNSDQQLLRVPIAEFNNLTVEEVLKEAISEFVGR